MSEGAGGGTSDWIGEMAPSRSAREAQNWD